MGKSFVIFGADMSSSVHIDNKGKYILILGEGLIQGLDEKQKLNIILILHNQMKRTWYIK